MVDWKGLAKKSIEKSTEAAKQGVSKSKEKADEKKREKALQEEQDLAFEKMVLGASLRAEKLNLKGKNKKQILEAEHIRNQQIRNNQFVFEKPAKTTVILDDNFIRITHKGLTNALTVGSSGEKAIKISDINSVQLSPPGGIVSGYLQFTLAGNKNTQGLSEAVKDENSIIFIKDDLDMAVVIKTIVEGLMAQDQDASGVTVNQQDFSPAEELRKYKALLDDGILTQDEFDAKKKQLLDM